MEVNSPNELILRSLKEKSSMKQDVFDNTLRTFGLLKSVIKEVAEDLNQYHKQDKRVSVEYKDISERQVQIRVAGDTVIFYMHTNVFDFDKSHRIWKTSYVKEDNFRSFCGMIQIFNFLADSFKYNRVNDLGYLIGRIFLNKESHYFVEGKRQLGFLYNDFVNTVIDRVALKAIVESAILYCLNFDLYTPPFDSVKEITVSDMQAAESNIQISTGKRLGFRFQADTDQIE
jgi:hypothetical protein